MNLSETPETDGEWNRIAHYDHPAFEDSLALFARDLERRLAAMTLTAKHEEESKEYNASLCYDQDRRLSVARHVLKNIHRISDQKSHIKALAWEALTIIGTK